MRIAHITDTHLGYRASTVSGREEDFAAAWIEACRAIVADKPDVILHAGDVFHRPHPSWGAVTTFIEGAKILQQAGCPILGITGNHDSPRLQMKSTVFSVLAETAPWIHLANENVPVLHTFEDLKLNVVLLPHPALLNVLLHKRLTEITEQLNPEWTNVLVAHGDIKSGSRGEGEELGSVAIPELVFDFDWDYAALGHLHLAQPFGPNGWYAGSTERCGWSDFPASPAWCSVRLEKGRSVTRSQRPLVHRSFVLLPEIDCKSVSDVLVVNEVVQSLGRQKLEDNALVRLILENAPYPRLRQLERTIRETARQLYPKIVLRVDFKKEDVPREIREREVKRDPIASLPEMFREFVEGRIYPAETSSEFVLERGLAALDKAGRSLDEGDTGDERTVARG